MHPEIFGEIQKVVLTRLAETASRGGFYLGGGTAVALHLGHRRSEDFDWFSLTEPEDAIDWAAELRTAIPGWVTGQLASHTVLGSIQGVRVSFFRYRYALLETPLNVPEYGIKLASLMDLAAMKIAAASQRGSRKDFIDLDAMLSNGLSLKDLLDAYRIRYGIEDIGHILNSLVYFEDAEREPLPVMIEKRSWSSVRSRLQQTVKDFARIS